MSEHSDGQSRPLADRRAQAGAPVEDEAPDYGEEHAPGPTDPPNAGAGESPGGQDEGYEPPTRA